MPNRANCAHGRDSPVALCVLHDSFTNSAVVYEGDFHGAYTELVLGCTTSLPWVSSSSQPHVFFSPTSPHLGTEKGLTIAQGADDALAQRCRHLYDRIHGLCAELSGEGT